MPDLIDSHAHLNFPAFRDDLDDVLKRAREAQVKRIINIGAGMGGMAGNAKALGLARSHPHIFATVGFHPHEAKDWKSAHSDELLELAKDGNVVAVGEIGLDFYKLHSPKDAQIKAFNDQLDVARRAGKPVVIHDREAHGEMMEILRRQGAPHGGVMHCYSGSLEMARELIEMGFYISIPGTVTYKNARVLPEVVKALPLERILIETDCPFLTPEPFRGKRNEPAYVRYVAEKVAKIRGIPFEEAARAATGNTEKIFGLPENT